MSADKHVPSDIILSLHTHPQHIIHQRPLPRPNFHQLHPTALAPLRNPLRNRPYPNQLAKHLRDLRRCDKVSLLSEYLPAAVRSCCVVAAFRGCEDLAHERGDGDWACHLSRGIVLAYYMGDSMVVERSGEYPHCAGQGLGERCRPFSFIKC